MNWARAIAGILVLWSSTVGAATLTWDPSTDPVAGYRVYQCSLLPCTKSADNLLVTLGAVTSFNIGTPAVTQYYFITVFDSANRESGSSNLAIFIPVGSPLPLPPPMRTVNLTVVGNPAAGMWGVEGSTTDLRDVMATVFLDGVVHHVEHYVPYGFPDDNGMTATLGRFGDGPHTVEFVFYLEGTTAEIGRANVTVQEGGL